MFCSILTFSSIFQNQLSCNLIERGVLCFSDLFTVFLLISLLGFGISAINNFIYSSLSWFYFFLCVLLSHLNVTENHDASVWFCKGEIHLFNQKSFSYLHISFVLLVFIQFYPLSCRNMVRVSCSAFLKEANKPATEKTGCLPVRDWSL